MRDLRKTDTHVCMDDSTDKRLRRSAREGARPEGGWMETCGRLQAGCGWVSSIGWSSW